MSSTVGSGAAAVAARKGERREKGRESERSTQKKMECED
jgi:hypothetical protein